LQLPLLLHFKPEPGHACVHFRADPDPGSWRLYSAGRSCRDELASVVCP
jgi:hypothetical protein